MSLSRRLTLSLLLATLAATVPASARLGDTLADLKKAFGAPERQRVPRKDKADWLFEGDDGQLHYSVTFNAEGKSIAEGLKPLKRARFNKDTAMNFIDDQLGANRSSKTMRVVKPGEAYAFAGQNFVCDKAEYVIVDETLGILVIWSQAGVPSVMIVSEEMMRTGVAAN